MGRRGLNTRKGILRATLPVLRRLPPRAALRAVGEFGRWEYRLVPSTRNRILEAIRQHAEALGEPWDPSAVGPELAANLIRSRARDLLLDGRTDAELEGVFRIEGREHLDGATAGGRGALLLANHFGAHLVGAYWIIRHGYPWRMFGERPRHISRLMAEQFALDGPLGQARLFVSRKANPAEAAGAILRAARVLRAGIVLSIASDVRWPTPPNATAEFLGRSYAFSSTWVTLAAHAGVPVVPMYCSIEPMGTYRVDFEPAFTLPTAAARDDRLAAHWVQHGLRLVENRVRRDPANSIDYFFWEEDEAGPRNRAMAG
ncbi:lysophospholipid acyltransferase family protein [Tautonia sociabilis]|uniref:Lauroyl acyltransferase n=1 Tax=Tautonia sociabilis TaxID=2080755 RepID=A0A432MG92_9BACT|nr:lauroyl acyltransferase [Tautonia sociabilis]RUL85617.1 lauroyl acyltransferase [Tautonia sociabilis]